MAVVKTIALAVAAAVALPLVASEAVPKGVSVEPAALLELLPHAIDAVAIMQRADEREARHREELRRKGIAEVPAERGERYVMKTPWTDAFAFDDFGELYIDLRFVTDEEMKTVHAIEEWIGKWFPREVKYRPSQISRVSTNGIPVFRGFASARYQQHDALILKLVAEFNANKAEWCGATVFQAKDVPDLTPALVKSHMIEETGGNGKRSLDAWAVDPLQVNEVGDWGEEKLLVGLKKPVKRNEGELAVNVKAGIMYLARKGFSTSARPPMERKNAKFDGWKTALRRYNGRRDRTDTDRYYSDEYADKVIRRAANPGVFVPIEIKVAKKSAGGK